MKILHLNYLAVNAVVLVLGETSLKLAASSEQLASSEKIG